MLRTLGAVCVMTGTGLLGMMVARTYGDRAAQLAALRRSLHVLETQVEYRAASLPEALEHVARVTDAPVDRLFARAARELTDHPGQSAQEAWEAALVLHGGELALWSEEMETLQGLGHSLGTTAAYDQVRHLRLAADLLAHHQRRAEHLRDTGTRLWRYLGFSTGAVVVILLY